MYTVGMYIRIVSVNLTLVVLATLYILHIPTVVQVHIVHIIKYENYIEYMVIYVVLVKPVATCVTRLYHTHTHRLHTFVGLLVFLISLCYLLLKRYPQFVGTPFFKNFQKISHTYTFTIKLLRLLGSNP